MLYNVKTTGLVTVTDKETGEKLERRSMSYTGSLSRKEYRERIINSLARDYDLQDDIKTFQDEFKVSVSSFREVILDGSN